MVVVYTRYLETETTLCNVIKSHIFGKYSILPTRGGRRPPIGSGFASPGTRFQSGNKQIRSADLEDYG